MGIADSFAARIAVRFLEADQQGVVFHMWYLAYLEDARNAFLAARDVPLSELARSGCQLQVVHTELDWSGSIHWGDEPVVSVRPDRVGRTSFTLDFVIRVGSQAIVRASTVYVTVGAGGGKIPLPRALRCGLTAATEGAGAS